ncbi:MAG: choice-of-anchor V domain-containing protein [bacterium]
MKKLILYLVSAAFIIGITAFSILNPTGKAGYSGAPGDGDCTSCHDGTVNSGSATASITSSPSLSSGYTPGTDYTISVTLSNSPAPNNQRFGVDAVALLSSGANGGTITITNTTLTKIKTHTVGSNTRSHVVQTGSGNTGPNTQTFSFKWTAPAAGKGTVTFYASLMGADNNGGNNGDEVYTTSLAANEITSSVLNPPELIYPANNALDRLLSEQLKWRKVADAQTYYIQVAKDAAFANILFQGNVGADTFKLVNTMAAETDYYWHVASVNTSGTSAYSAAWKFTTSFKPIVLQTPTSAKVNVPIDTKFTWLANTAGTQYQIQISKLADFSTTTVDTKVSNVLEYQSTVLEYYQNYHWRVRLVVGTRVGLWSDVWSFKTAVKSPELVYPVNNGIDRLLSEQFKWRKVANAQSYYIQVSKDAAFTSIFFEGSAGADTFKLISNMLAETDYYWHVASVTTDGTSAYSANWKLKTSYKPIVLQTPTNLKVNVPLETKFTWLANTAGTQYQIQISKVADFATTVADEKVSNKVEFQTTILEPYQSYYWRVRLVVGTSLGLWSDVWSFKTVVKSPELLLPANNAENESLSLTAKWRKVTGAQSYYIQIGNDAGFSSILFEGNVGADTFKLINNLLAEIQYYWHVAAVTTDGTGAYSATWRFKTGTTSPVVLQSPANEAVNLPLDTKFTWFAHSGGSQYQIQISKVADFQTTVVDEKINNKLEFQTTVLEYYQNYFWRVRLIVGTSLGQWSDAWSITTKQVTMTLSNPANGSANLTIPLQLSWFPAATAEYYHLQLASDANFANIILDKNSIYDTKYLLTEADITIGTQYFWHVKGVNTQDNIPWSDGWQFTTSSVSVKESEQFTAIQLYPNPSGSKAVLSISYAESTEAKILISSADGKLVKSDILNFNSGETSYEINTDSLSSGTYYITIITPSGFISRELVVAK